jgi:hypothetical protein
MLPKEEDASSLPVVLGREQNDRLRQQPGLKLNCQAAVLLLRSKASQGVEVAGRDHRRSAAHPSLTQLARAQGSEAHPPEQEGQWPIDLPRVLAPPGSPATRPARSLSKAGLLPLVGLPRRRALLLLLRRLRLYRLRLFPWP